MTNEKTPTLRPLARYTLVCYWIALVLGTHWPRLPAIGPDGTDKILHTTAYAGLAFLLSINLFWGRPTPWWKYAIVYIGVAIFGGLDELTQPPFHRTADWYDWFADLRGAAIGLALSYFAHRVLRKKLAATHSPTPPGRGPG
ncbi:MAG TPA: VanZ family protein [Pirellulales bacterium]|jgi:VanZ family protein